MHLCGFMCGFVRVCMCACVFACLRAYNDRMGVQIQHFQNTVFLYSIQAKPKTSFTFLGRVTDWNSPIVSCEKECSGARDGGIYECVPVRRFFVVNSRHLVLARIQTPQKSYKILENAVSDTLLMSGFRFG